MELPSNKFKASLRARTPQLGMWCGLGSPLVAEIAGDAGFDFVIVDQEHTINDIALTLSQLQALGCTQAAAAVRLPSNDPVQFKRVLDIGAQTVFLPMVETAEEAAAAVASTRYPPHGKRGVYLGGRGRRFGRVGDYFQRAQDEICLIVQIETRAGIEQLEAIASVEGVDGVFIGSSDLSADMGHIGDPSHPQVREIVVDAAQRLKNVSCPAGTVAFADMTYSKLVSHGYTFVTVGTDIGALTAQTDAWARQR